MRRHIIIFVTGAVHFVITLTATMAESLTGAFLFSPPSPSHGFWNVMMVMFEFPLVTIIHVLRLSETNLHLAGMIVNSLLWGVLLTIAFPHMKRYVGQQSPIFH